MREGGGEGGREGLLAWSMCALFSQGRDGTDGAAGPPGSDGTPGQNGDVGPPGPEGTPVSLLGAARGASLSCHAFAHALPSGSRWARGKQWRERRVSKLTCH